MIRRLRLAVCLAAVAAMLCSVAAISGGAAVIKYVRGDADGDGYVNINDVTKIQRVLADLESDSNDAVKRSCDFNNNGLDIDDATNLQRYLAEFGNSYRIGEIFSYDEYELPFIPVH